MDCLHKKKQAAKKPLQIFFKLTTGMPSQTNCNWASICFLIDQSSSNFRFECVHVNVRHFFYKKILLF